MVAEWKNDFDYIENVKGAKTSAQQVCWIFWHTPPFVAHLFA